MTNTTLFVIFVLNRYICIYIKHIRSDYLGYHMKEHLESILMLDENASVQMPNDIFLKLNRATKQFSHTSFAYSYLILSAFLYKYAYYVDIDSKSYVEQKDMKMILGYSGNTRSINYLIKKDGILDRLDLTSTTSDFPIRYTSSTNEEINGFALRDFVTISQIKETDEFYYSIVKSVVSNYNYQIKMPKFLFSYNDDIGTLYNYENTHKILLREFIELIYEDSLKSYGFALYSYFKSRCHGLEDKKKNLSLSCIICDTGVNTKTFYELIKKLELFEYIRVDRKGWRNEMYQKVEPNTYHFLGI